MKRNDRKELFGKDIETLTKSLKDARSELAGLIVDNSQFKLKNMRSIFNKKKEIAMILTAKREKELAQKI